MTPGTEPSRGLPSVQEQAPPLAGSATAAAAPPWARLLGALWAQPPGQRARRLHRLHPRTPTSHIPTNHMDINQQRRSLATG